MTLLLVYSQEFNYIAPMLGLKKQTWVTIFGVLSLIAIVVVQVLPHNASFFDLEISQSIECEESDADEKDLEEEEMKKNNYWKDSNRLIQLPNGRVALFESFKGSYLSGPYLDQHLPPPDRG